MASRHFAGHGCQIQTCRIEDRRIVSEPKVFDLVFGGCRVAREARPETQLTKVPPNTLIRGEDGPSKSTEAPNEKRRIRPDNEMFGAVPRYIGFDCRIRGTGDLAKADEGTHLVDVSANSPFHETEFSYRRLGMVFEQMRFTAGEPPQKPVKQVPAVGMTMVADGFCQL